MNQDDEEISVFKFVIALITFEKGKYFLRIFGMLIFFLTPITTTYLIKQIFEKLTGNPSIQLGLWTIILLIPAIRVVRILTNILNGVLQFMFIQSIEILMRSNLLNGILKQPGASALKDSSPGEAISRFRGDSMEISGFIAYTGYVIAFSLFFILSFFSMFFINQRVAVLVTLPNFFVLIIIYRARNKQKEYRRMARKAAGQVTSTVGEAFGAIQSIKIATAEESLKKYFEDIGEQRRSASVKDATFLAFLRGFGTMILGISTGILLFSAANDMVARRFSIGDFVFFISLLIWMQAYIDVLAELISWQARSAVSYKRMYKLIKGVRPDSRITELIEHHDIRVKNSIQNIEDPTESLKVLSVRDLKVVLEDNGSEFTLENISFDINAGEFVAVIGKVGSGKTTLLRSILGLLPIESGNILWNGEVVNSYKFFKPPVSTYTPQLPTLFSESIEENILMGLDSDEKKLAKIIDLAVLGPDIASFENGVKTIIGPKGIKLSGGQKHRVAAARMIIRKSELTVVDNLSSALDVATEEELWNGLFQNHRSTFLVVSHRPNVLMRADKLLVLDHGKLIASGKLNELIATNSIVKEIWGTITGSE